MQRFIHNLQIVAMKTTSSTNNGLTYEKETREVDVNLGFFLAYLLSFTRLVKVDYPYSSNTMSNNGSKGKKHIDMKNKSIELFFINTWKHNTKKCLLKSSVNCLRWYITYMHSMHWLTWVLPTTLNVYEQQLVRGEIIL